jgi:hypothetical protein
MRLGQRFESARRLFQIGLDKPNTGDGGTASALRRGPYTPVVHQRRGVSLQVVAGDGASGVGYPLVVTVWQMHPGSGGCRRRRSDQVRSKLILAWARLLHDLLPRDALLMFVGTVFIGICTFSGVVVAGRYLLVPFGERRPSSWIGRDAVRPGKRSIHRVATSGAGGWQDKLSR